MSCWMSPSVFLIIPGPRIRSDQTRPEHIGLDHVAVDSIPNKNKKKESPAATSLPLGAISLPLDRRDTISNKYKEEKSPAAMG